MNDLIDPSTSINNVELGKDVKIAKRCSIFGSDSQKLRIGDNSYIGMNAFINGYLDSLVIGRHVSIAQNVCIMTDSGPNASIEMQKFFPLEKGPVQIGDHSWIGANSIILPNSNLGEFCVVAANSLVKGNFPSYSMIGGNPAKIIRMIGKDDL